MVVAYAVGVSAQLIVADLWRKRHDEPTLIQLAMTATWWTALDVCIGMIGAKSPAGAASQWMRVSFWLCFTLYYIVANVQNVRTASAPACPKARRMHAQPDEAPCEAG
jgi:hypothetical protein